MSRCATPPGTPPPIGFHSPSPLPAIRNLGPELMKGVIFTCTDNSFNDCIKAGIFGLPRTHFQYVQYVRPSMVLFLFNYSTRELHGIFRSKTAGKLDGEPAGVNREWAASFPAQVYVDTSDKYPPLPESIFRRAIVDNYYSSNSTQFSFELDAEQVARLCDLIKQYSNRNTPSHGGGRLTPSLESSKMQSWDGTQQEQIRRINERQVISPLGFNRPNTGFLSVTNTRPQSALDSWNRQPIDFEPSLFPNNNNFLQNLGLEQASNRSSFNINGRHSHDFSAGASIPSGRWSQDPERMKRLTISDILQRPRDNLSMTMDKQSLFVQLEAQQQLAQQQQPLLNDWNLNLISQADQQQRLMGLVGNFSDCSNIPSFIEQQQQMAKSRATPETDKPRTNIWQVNSQDDVNLINPISPRKEKIERGVVGGGSQFGLNLNPNISFSGLNQAVQPFQLQGLMDIPPNEATILNMAQNLEYHTPQAFKSLNGNYLETWQEQANGLNYLRNPLNGATDKEVENLTSGINNIEDEWALNDLPGGMESCFNSEQYNQMPEQDKVNIKKLEADEENMSFNFTNENTGILTPFGSSILATNISQHIGFFSEPLDLSSDQNGVLGCSSGPSPCVSFSEIPGTSPFRKPPTPCREDEDKSEIEEDNATAASLEVVQISEGDGQNVKELIEEIRDLRVENTNLKALIDSQQNLFNDEMSDICVISSVTEPGCLTTVTADVFNTDSNEWYKSVAVRGPVPFGLNIAPVGSSLYLLGGSEVIDKYPTTTKMCSIDLITGGVQDEAPLSFPRFRFNMASLNGKIYVVGGMSANSTTEIYDPELQIWTQGGNLITGRHSFGLTVVDNVLYAIGGLDNSVALSSVEMYDPRIGKWAQAGVLSTRRFGAACTALKGGMAAIGGCSYNGHVLSTGEHYDARTRMSLTLPNLSMPRVDASAIYSSNTLYIIGGCDSQSYPLSNIEILITASENTTQQIYNPRTSAASSTVFHAASPIKRFLL